MTNRPEMGVIWSDGQHFAKEFNVQFVLAYNPDEFAESRRALPEAEIDIAPLVTGQVELDGFGNAFGGLADPERHC